MAKAQRTVKIPQETYQSMRLTEANIETNTQRGWPQIWIDLFADGRPRITGIGEGLNLAAKCGDNCLIVLVILSLKVPAKLSFRHAVLRAVKRAATMARGLLRNPNPRITMIMMK